MRDDAPIVLPRVGNDGPATAEGVVCRAVFLTTKPDPAFAMVHIPSRPRSDATGVIICPAFAGEDLFTYQTRRAWAEALAQAGHPTLRLDLPGMGDSGGSPLATGRVDAWKEAVSSAASWLCDEIGCARIAALGIGFGGMMAWLAASAGAPIDDLMMWGVPTSGRRLLREVRAAALFDIARDPDLEGFAPPVPAPPEGESLLDESGQVATKETIEALSQIDLTTLELPEPARRRVLVFERDGVATDEKTSAYFRARGFEVTIADGNSYGAMMRYVEDATVPKAAIARSVSWLAGSDRLCQQAPRAAPTTPRAASVKAVSSVTLHHDGAAVRETMLTSQVDSVTLRGVVTEPVDAAPAGICVVFFSGGSDRRIGPNRLWVDVARRWATQGVSSVRIDSEGIGDADGDERYWATPRGHYDRRHVPKTIALLNELETRGLPPRFVLVGFCSGGYRSFQVARADQRIAGVLAIAFPFFFWSRWTVKVRHSWVRAWKRRPTDPPAKAATIWTLRSLWRMAEHVRRIYMRYLRRHPDKVDRSLDALRDQGTELLLLYRSNSIDYLDLSRDKYMPRIEAMPNVRVNRIPGPDVRFRPLASQLFVSNELDAALVRVLASEGAAATSAAEDRARAGAGPVPSPPSPLLADAPAHGQAADTNGLSDSVNMTGAAASTPSDGVAVRTLVIARPRRASITELRRQIAADMMPDVIRADDAIGATHIDDRYFAALDGVHGRVCRRLPLSIAQLLEVMLRGRYYDAVVTWSDRPAIALGTLMLCWKQRPAHVAIVMWPSKRKKAIPLRVAQRGIDRFVACSPLQLRFLRERLGIGPDRLVDVKGRRIDTHFWRPLPGAGDLICSVGQEMRDYSTLVAALEPLDIRCHIAPGTGIVGASSAKWWRLSLERSELPGTLSVASHSYAQLRELYARARFVVVPLFPSDTDNGVTTILEAFAMGKPVICTESPGQVGVVEHGVNGLCVPPGDPVALRNAIAELWSDPERCALMGAAGRELVLTSHGLERWTASLVTAVEGAVAARAKAGRTRVSERAPLSGLVHQAE